MTIDDAIQAMTVIDRQRNGTEVRAVICDLLNEKLLADPELFWEFYFKVMDSTCPNSYRDLAEQLFRDGFVDEQTTFSELPGVLAKAQK